VGNPIAGALYPQQPCWLATGGEERILDDIARIDSACHTRIETAAHHSIQRIAVTIKQAIDRVSIALLSAI
jgi:hypothetical protein